MDDDKAQQKLDIACLVEHYREVHEQLLPLRVAWDFIVSIWRWESVGLSLLVVSLAALITLYPPMLLGVMLCSILLWVLAGLWNTQSTTHSSITSQQPQGQVLDEHKRAMKNCRKEEKNTLCILQESRSLIKTADTLLLQIMNAISYFKSIFYWENARRSLSVIVVCVIVLMMLIRSISVPTLLSLVIVIVFFSSPHFIQICKQRISKTMKSLSTSKESTAPSRAHTPPSLPASRDEQETAVTSRTETRAIETSSEEAHLTEGGERFQSSTRIIGSSTGSCFQCNSVFNILKRRYICNLCGHTFCNNCSVKVPRSSLGATSPTAHETVRVCSECKNNLYM